MSSNETLEQLRETYSSYKRELEDFQKLANSEAEVTPEQYKRSEEVLTEIESVQNKIKTKEMAQAAEKFTRNDYQGIVPGKAPGMSVKRKATRKDADNALKAWMLHGHQRVAIKDSWKRSADLVESDYAGKHFYCNDSTWYSRAQATDDSTASNGDDLLNGSYLQTLVEAKAFEGSILPYCDVINSPWEEAEQPIHFAVNDDTTVYGAYKAQNEGLTNQTLTYDRVTLNTNLCTTAVYPVSISYLMNNNTNVLDHINRSLGARLRRTILRDILSGNGSNAPTGVLEDVEKGHTAVPGDITPNDIRELWYSIDPEYRQNAIFVAHDGTVKSLEQSLVSGEDGSIREWGVDLNSAPTATMRGKPFITSNFMPEMSDEDEKQAILFGDFFYHKVRFIGTPQLVRDDSRLVDSLSVFFAAYQMTDSHYVNPNASGNGPIVSLNTDTDGSAT